MVPIDFVTNAPPQPLKLPFVPNSMVISNDGSSIYMGSANEIMVVNAHHQCSLARGRNRQGARDCNLARWNDARRDRSHTRPDLSLRHLRQHNFDLRRSGNPRLLLARQPDRLHHHRHSHHSGQPCHLDACRHHAKQSITGTRGIHRMDGRLRCRASLRRVGHRTERGRILCRSNHDRTQLLHQHHDLHRWPVGAQQRVLPARRLCQRADRPSRRDLRRKAHPRRNGCRRSNHGRTSA